MVGLHGEVFTEIEIKIKESSSFNFTMVITLTNDSLDYIPTSEAYQSGGYEVKWPGLAAGTDKIILNALYNLMEELKNGR